MKRPALKVIPKNKYDARPPQERLSFQQWVEGDFRVMRTLAVLFWSMIFFGGVLFVSGTTLFPFSSSLIFRLDSLFIWECIFLFFASQLALVPYEQKCVVTFTRPVQPSRLLQILQFLSWRRVVFFLLHFLTSLLSLFSLLSLRDSATPFSPFTCSDLPESSSSDSSEPSNNSSESSDSPTIPDGYTCMEETTLLHLQFCFVFSFLFSLAYFLSESHYLLLPLTHSPPLRTFSSYFLSLVPFSLILSLVSCFLTFGGRYILGTFLSQMSLDVLSWFLGQKVMFLVIREGQWGWMALTTFHSATVIGVCWIGRHAVLKVLTTMRFCFYDRVLKGFRVNYDAKISNEDMFLIQALRHQDGVIAGLARLDLFYLLQFEQGRRMTIFDDDIRRSPCLIAEELKADVDDLTSLLDRITHMNVMKEEKDEWAKREIEKRMIEEKERRERQRKMEEGGKKGRGARERRGLLVAISPVSFGRALEEVGRILQNRLQALLGLKSNTNNNLITAAPPPNNPYPSTNPYASPFRPRGPHQQQHQQQQHQQQQHQPSPYGGGYGETPRRGGEGGRGDELMSPFRRSSHHLPPTPSSGLRGMGGEGLRRRGGREGGERERVGWEGEEKGGRGVGEVMREYFEQNYLRPFEGWRQTGVALADYQRFRLSIESLSLLLQISGEEDHMGMLNVSGYFEESICSLLSCVIALETHMKTTGPSPNHPTSQTLRLPSFSLLLVLQNAIYGIVAKYYSSLSSLKLPPSHTQKLQEFVSFQVM